MQLLNSAIEKWKYLIKQVFLGHLSQVYVKSFINVKCQNYDQV